MEEKEEVQIESDTLVHTHTYTHARPYAYTHVRTHAHTHTHTHTHTHNPPRNALRTAACMSGSHDLAGGPPGADSLTEPTL